MERNCGLSGEILSLATRRFTKVPTMPAAWDKNGGGDLGWSDSSHYWELGDPSPGTTSPERVVDFTVASQKWLSPTLRIKPYGLAPHSCPFSDGAMLVSELSPYATYYDYFRAADIFLPEGGVKRVGLPMGVTDIAA